MGTTRGESQSSLIPRLSNQSAGMWCWIIWSRSTTASGRKAKSVFHSSSLRLKQSSPKVTIPNPEHLLQQAEKLIGAPTLGQPRQVDIRRAISAAYYALFHAASIEAADNLVGARNRNTQR